MKGSVYHTLELEKQKALLFATLESSISSWFLQPSCYIILSVLFQIECLHVMLSLHSLSLSSIRKNYFLMFFLSIHLFISRLILKQLQGVPAVSAQHSRCLCLSAVFLRVYFKKKKNPIALGPPVRQQTAPVEPYTPSAHQPLHSTLDTHLLESKTLKWSMHSC